MVMPSGMTVFVQPKISSFGLVLMSALHSPPAIEEAVSRVHRDESENVSSTHYRLV